MSELTESLPADPEKLLALLISARVERDAARSEVARIEMECDLAIAQNDRLRHIVRQLQRGVFGPKSEKLDADQIEMALESYELGEAKKQNEKVKSTGSRPRARGDTRRSLPAHLPHVEVMIAPEDKACPCGSGTMHVICEEKSERLDIIPAHYRVLVTRRPKYACRGCESVVVQAPPLIAWSRAACRPRRW